MCPDGLCLYYLGLTFYAASEINSRIGMPNLVVLDTAVFFSLFTKNRWEALTSLSP